MREKLDVEYAAEFLQGRGYEGAVPLHVALHLLATQPKEPLPPNDTGDQAPLTSTQE